MSDPKEYADRLKFEIEAADFLTTEDREMVFTLSKKCWVRTDLQKGFIHEKKE